MKISGNVNNRPRKGLLNLGDVLDSGRNLTSHHSSKPKGFDHKATMLSNLVLLTNT